MASRKMTPEELTKAAEMIEIIETNKRLIAECRQCMDYAGPLEVKLGGRKSDWTFRGENKSRLVQHIIDGAQATINDLTEVLSPFVDLGDGAPADSPEEATATPDEYVSKIPTCVAMTAAGAQCTRRPWSGTAFCGVHRVNRPHGIQNGSAVVATP